MQCYIINLDRDTERIARARAALAPHAFMSEIRIDAIRGSSLPNIACNILARKAEMVNHKGTLGCSLSHALAWEAIVRTKAECALILEDDAEPTDIEQLRDFILPSEIDLVFCNGRMAYQDAGVRLLPLMPAFEFIIRNATGVGTDAYLLSNGGARKLLSFFLDDGFYSHVDLRLAAYSLTLEEIEALPQSKYVIRDICTLRRIYDATHHLSARVLGTAITRHAKGAPSSRSAEDARSRL